MPIQMTCPVCRARISIPEASLGKKVRCTRCEHFVTPQASQDDAVDVVVVEAPDAAAVTAAPRAPKRRFEDDDEPARARTAPVAKKSSPVLWIFLGVGLLLLLPCCGVGGMAALWFWRSESSPDKQQVSVADFQPKEQEMKAVKAPNPEAKPPVPAVPQNVVVKRFAQRQQLDCKDSEVRDILFSNEDTKQVAIYSHIESRIHRVDRYDLGAMRKVASFELNDPKLIGDMKSLSPEGTVFAYEDSKDFIVVCSAVDGKQVARWQPYARQGKLPAGTSPYEGRLARFEFLTENRLLTINQAGGLDLWSLPDLQPVYHSKAATKGPFFNAHWGLAISPGRRTVAVFNGKGFNFMDAATGDLVSKTETLPDNPAVSNVWGTSFSGDGSQIVAAFTIKPVKGGQELVLASFDVKTGQSSGFMPTSDLAVGTAPNPMYWGPNHLFIVGMGARNGGQVIEWPTHKWVRQFQTGNNNVVGFVARYDLANRLWYAAGQADFNPAYLVAIDLPEDGLRMELAKPDLALRLTAEGIIKKP